MGFLQTRLFSVTITGLILVIVVGILVILGFYFGAMAGS